MLILPRAERPFAKGPYVALVITVVATEPWRPANYFEGEFDAVVIAKALLSLLGALVAWLLVRTRPRRAVPAWPAVLATLYVAVTVFGGWADGNLVASTVIAVRVLLLVLIIYVLLSGYDGYAVMAGMVGALATVGSFSLLTGFGRTHDGRLAGGLPPLHPNEIAAISAVVILWLLYRAVNGRERAIDLLALAVAVGALLASGSRTSLAMVVPAAITLLIMARRVHLRVLVPFLLGLPVLMIWLISTNALTDALTRDGSTQDLTSLSNRTIAWQAALMPKSDEWLAWFGGGLSMKRIEVPGQWWSHQILDSSWISALIQGGYLGMTLCVALIAYGSYRVARVPGELRGFRLALILFFTLRGVLESGLFDASTAFLACFTALALPEVPRPPREGINPSGHQQHQPIRWHTPHAMTSGGSMRSIKKRFLIAGNLLALGLLIAGLVNFFTPRLYESSASLYATAAGRQLRASDIYQGTMMVSARMNTYVELATSPVVLRAAIEELQLEESPASLAERITATNPPQTAVLTITATDRDPAQAQLIAATVATKFYESVSALEQGSGAVAQVEFRPVSPADAPASPSSPNQLQNLGIGALVGGSLGLLIFLWPLARIVASPSGQLRVIILGPMADRLDTSTTRIVGEVSSSARPTPPLASTTSSTDGR